MCLYLRKVETAVGPGGAAIGVSGRPTGFSTRQCGESLPEDGRGGRVVLVSHVDVGEELRGAGAGRGDLVGLALSPGAGLGLATASGAFAWSSGTEDAADVVKLVKDALRPRWVWWSNQTAVPLVRAGVRVATCWDIAAVHRLPLRRVAGRPGRRVGAPAPPAS